MECSRSNLVPQDFVQNSSSFQQIRNNSALSNIANDPGKYLIYFFDLVK